MNPEYLAQNMPSNLTFHEGFQRVVSLLEKLPQQTCEGVLFVLPVSRIRYLKNTSSLIILITEPNSKYQH